MNHLSDEQREVFAGAFYAAWDAALDIPRDTVSGNPTPWGCPWYYDASPILLAKTPAEMGVEYFYICLPDILAEQPEGGEHVA